MTYQFAELALTTVYFAGRRSNERVWQFHERFGAIRTAESDLDYFYQLDGKAIAASRERYRRFLDGRVSVVFP